ncbi:GntR family transcriptional regulator [Desulfosediminicola ganghwensis]|uniref:GntR family transcriptional regulator n=1 Tax=Desulfosediminicola ganghwensis TaxID=2569540 RepID=UPI0010AD3A71|nr:GntR family transcriptional regulator [Desulfosediminicola ganghwensis]
MGFEKHTYTERVVNYIKECILNGTYKPGNKVKELTIAQELSISRAPVREALQVLIQEGLVIWIPQKGKFITKLNSEQIRNSYFTGGILEGAAVAQAVDLYTDRDYKRLEAINEKMLEVTESKNSFEAFAALDDKFHKILLSKIDNDLLKEFCKRSCQGISKFLLYKYWIAIFTPDEVYVRHKKIVDALKERNADKLEKVIRAHYIDIGERITQVKEKADAEVA